MTALFAWIQRQFDAYTALPAPIRAWIIRAYHTLVGFIGIITTVMVTLHISFWRAIWPALVGVLTGQYALRTQVPRDPAQYAERVGEKPGEDSDDVQ